MKIVLASNNPGKIQEIKALLVDLPIDLISQSELNISEIAETGTTFIENALIKARHASNVSGLPALADDSGLAIDALGGAPGVYSSRYAGKDATHLDCINKVLAELEGVPDNKRTARFYCAIAFVRNVDDPSPLVCEGVWPGTIMHAPRGTKGFGYDPIFYLPEYQCSAAELEPKFKNQISHRGQAMTEFRKKLARMLVTIEK